jgi:hypothetical protein
MFTQFQRPSRKFTGGRSSNPSLPALHTALLLFENRFLQNDTILPRFAASVSFCLYSLGLNALAMRFGHSVLLEYGFLSSEGLQSQVQSFVPVFACGV